MDYETAKKLKDAGFPQVGDGRVNIFNVYFPTLEELIEACGDDIKGLLVNPVAGKIGLKWLASNLAENKFGIGETPIKAVTDLWLELRK